MFAFIPERDRRYEILIVIEENDLEVQVYDETSGRTPVATDQHYLIACARQNAADIDAAKGGQ